MATTLSHKGKLSVPGIEDAEFADTIPIDYILGRIRKVMPQFGAAPPNDFASCVFILKGMTGSGKSTAFPVGIFENLYKEGKQIMVTQPRIITAQDIPRDISTWSKSLKLGDNMGFMTSIEKESPNAKMVFATIGTLKMQLMMWSDQEIMRKYSFILLDEVHERSVELDHTLYLMRAFIERNLGNPNLPITVLMSATINYEKYAKYFDIPLDNVFIVSGTAHERKVVWPKYGTDDYIASGIAMIKEIHEKIGVDDSDTQNDIIFFITGAPDIRAVESQIEQLNVGYAKSSYGTIFFIPVIGSDKDEGSRKKMLDWKLDDIRAYAKDNKIKRRLIVATNAAETGLTVRTAKYCIDSGLRRSVYYSPKVNAGLSFRGPSTQGQLEQRKGRIGRVFNGIFYPLYTESVFNQLHTDSFPETFTSDISMLVLNLLYSKANINNNVENYQKIIEEYIPTKEDINNIPLLLDPLPLDLVQSIIDRIESLGFLNSRMGLLATRIDCPSIESIRMILSGYIWDTNMRDLITIAAAIGMSAKRDIIDRKTYNADVIFKEVITNAGLSRDMTSYGLDISIADEFINYIFILRAFEIEITSDYDISHAYDWCSSHGINYMGMLEMLTQRDKILTSMYRLGFNLEGSNGKEPMSICNHLFKEDFMDCLTRIKKCIYDGYKNNMLIYDKEHNNYKSLLSGINVKVPKNYNSVHMGKRGERDMELIEKPQIILFNKLYISATPEGKFATEADCISVMDGFVPIVL
jgi:HrpA-like RNA helicase